MTDLSQTASFGIMLYSLTLHASPLFEPFQFIVNDTTKSSPVQNVKLSNLLLYSHYEIQK